MKLTGKQELQKLHASCFIISTHKITRNMVAHIKENILILLYAFFWVILRRLNFICRRFGVHCVFHLHRQIGMKMPMKKEHTVCPETSEYKIQTPEN
jgi:hypothetical protein